MAAQPTWTAHADRLNLIDDLMSTCRGTQFTFQWQRRTSNRMKPHNGAIRRRERVIRIVPNRESAIRLLGALLLEQAELWSMGQRYLDMIAHGQWRREHDPMSQSPASPTAPTACRRTATELRVANR